MCDCLFVCLVFEMAVSLVILGRFVRFLFPCACFFALVLLGMIKANGCTLFSCVVLRDVVILMSGLHSSAFSSEVQTPNLLFDGLTCIVHVILL